MRKDHNTRSSQQTCSFCEHLPTGSGGRETSFGATLSKACANDPATSSYHTQCTLSIFVTHYNNHAFNFRMQIQKHRLGLQNYISNLDKTNALYIQPFSYFYQARSRQRKDKFNYFLIYYPRKSEDPILTLNVHRRLQADNLYKNITIADTNK